MLIRSVIFTLLPGTIPSAWVIPLRCRLYLCVVHEYWYWEVSSWSRAYPIVLLPSKNQFFHNLQTRLSWRISRAVRVVNSFGCESIASVKVTDSANEQVVSSVKLVGVLLVVIMYQQTEFWNNKCKYKLDLQIITTILINLIDLDTCRKSKFYLDYNNNSNWGEISNYPK